MSHDPALPRFILLQCARLTAAMIALAGAVVLSHGLPALAHVPDAVGDVLIVGGALGFFLVPYALARHWKRQS